jgi:hypothetical protein
MAGADVVRRARQVLPRPDGSRSPDAVVVAPAGASHRPRGCDGGAGLGGEGRRPQAAIGRAVAAAVPGPAGDGVTGHVVSAHGLSDVRCQEAGVTEGGPWRKP